MQSAAIGVTLKSVNHRFLDLQLRTPGSLAALENRIRALVQSRVARGRVEVTVTVQQRRESSVEVELNEAFLHALKPALERARQLGLIEGPMTAGDLLRFPQALAIREKLDETDGEDTALAKAVEESLAEALDELDRMRVREGGYLRADLDARRDPPWRPVRAGGGCRRRWKSRAAGAAC